MAVTITFDPATKIIDEPGFHQLATARDLSEKGFMEGVENQKLWADPWASVLMLKPRQLDEGFLDTSHQTASIIRLSLFDKAAADVTAGNLFEAPVGNNSNPWVFFVPVGPAAAFPPGSGPPGAAPIWTGLTPAGEIADIPLTSVNDVEWTEPLAAVPAAGSEPAPVVIGDYDDAVTICETTGTLPANAPLLIRMAFAGGRPNYSPLLEFHIGQFALVIRNHLLEVWRDTSAVGDRSQGKKVFQRPLFYGENKVRSSDSYVDMSSPASRHLQGEERYLLWIPYRRNKVLLLSSYGQAELLTTRPDTEIRRNSADTDWVNVREDTIRVKALSPVWGRFQIQRLLFHSSAVMQAKEIRVPYTPDSAPTLSLYRDADNTTTLTGAHSSPPSYPTTPAPDRDDCPPESVIPSFVPDSRHGVELTFTASADQRFTPFFYGYRLESPTTLMDAPTTPEVVTDSGSGARLIAARFSAGLKPGEGRGVAEILDRKVGADFELEALYYRSAVPVEIKEDATVLFRGIAGPLELLPFHESEDRPRRFIVPLMDRWKILTRSFFRDDRSYVGVGHIDAVLDAVKGAGIDITTAETPAITAANNTKLGLLQQPLVSQQNDDLRSAWRPEPATTVAEFVTRVAEWFSGWYVGFRPDGTFFYLPKDHFTTSSLTFYPSQEAADAALEPDAPLYRSPVHFRVVEPEANVIVVAGGKAADGSRSYSPVMIDRASLVNPDVVNYVGQWWAEIVEVAGAHTCAELQWIARKIWDQTRRRIIEAEFETLYQDTLKVGQVVTLSPYGDYRILSATAALERSNWHPASYSAEFLDSGYGLPPPEAFFHGRSDHRAARERRTDRPARDRPDRARTRVGHRPADPERRERPGTALRHDWGR